MPHSVKIATTEKDGVDVVFEEQADGRITVSFEGGSEDADVFVSHLSDELATYKGMLADQKRRAQLARDRSTRLEQLKAKKTAADEKGGDLPQSELFTDGDQAELDHLTELDEKGEL